MTLLRINVISLLVLLIIVLPASYLIQDYYITALAAIFALFHTWTIVELKKIKENP